MTIVASAPRQLIVFISSTYVDLQQHREKVEEVLTRIEASFRSMRYFGSRQGEPLEQCLAQLRQCNYYIGLIGHKYGSTHESLGHSYTEAEYEEAKRLGIKRRIYFADSSVRIHPDQVESDQIRLRLESFKQKLKKENTIVSFSSPDDLATKLISDILLSVSEKEEISSFARDKYLPALRKTCSSISFLGLDIRSMKRHQDVDLEKVYVQSKFVPFGRTGKRPLAQQPLPGLAEPRRGSRTREKPVSLHELFSRAKQVVVLGDPGSGKTTLAKYLVVGLVDGSSEIGPLAKGLLPIRIQLRSYAEYRQRNQGIGVSILDFATAFSKTELQLDSLPTAFFEYFLQTMQAILIFDGLDEIFNMHLREQVRSDVSTFLQVSYPGNKAIITSRKVGYEDAGFSKEPFAHFEILPFTDEQVSEYVRKWYDLEESDRHKREEEISAFTKEKQTLPGELLSNPLLLSLIVILFRSGCTLPESKLEIYRSCIGTLTEKWDAAGKRLELPSEYNLVRDKRGAFARIAYWMYKEMSLEESEPIRLRYSDILTELIRHLCEREFKGRESEATQAAEQFLDYAAKRSVFVEDRFSHKTFHEYFAALYLYSNFCLGKTVDALFAEIRPNLKSDYWAVVLELLFLMLDEQAASLVDAIFDRIAADARSAPGENYGILLTPLGFLAQLQNVGKEAVQSLILAAVEICASQTVTQIWHENLRDFNWQAQETRSQRVFSALDGIPERWFHALEEALGTVAKKDQRIEKLLPIAAFCAESKRGPIANFRAIIPSWEEGRDALARTHFSIFLHTYISDSFSARLQKFVEYFGVNRLYHYSNLVFRPNMCYSPLSYHLRAELVAQEDPTSYASKIEELLASPHCEHVIWVWLEDELRGARRAYYRDPAAPIAHLRSECTDRRAYLFDWLILIRCALDTLKKAGHVGDLRSLARDGSPPQRFYSSLLLGRERELNQSVDLGFKQRIIGLLNQVIEATLAARKKPLKRKQTK